jgi:hypothetical protein
MEKGKEQDFNTESTKIGARERRGRDGTELVVLCDARDAAAEKQVGGGA